MRGAFGAVVLAAWLPFASTASAVIEGAEDTTDAVVRVVLPMGDCSGALFAPDAVLTAAHCVDDAQAVVVAGETIAVRFGVRHPDASFPPHGEPVRPETLSHDVGVLFLAAAAPAHVEPLTIATKGPAERERATLVGWGCVAYADDPLEPCVGSGVRRAKDVHVSFAEVGEGWGAEFFAVHFGAEGDSGAPVLRGREILGVQSAGGPGVRSLVIDVAGDIGRWAMRAAGDTFDCEHCVGDVDPMGDLAGCGGCEGGFGSTRGGGDDAGCAGGDCEFRRWSGADATGCEGCGRAAEVRAAEVRTTGAFAEARAIDVLEGCAVGRDAPSAWFASAGGALVISAAARARRRARRT